MSIYHEESYQQRILSVLIYIQNHLDKELSLEELAAVAFFSPYHFHRIFKMLTGESVKSYVRRLRLERATRDLVFTDKSIVQISERAGYDAQQSFHRAFQDAYHQTPKTYRQSILKNISQLSEAQENNHQMLVSIHIIEPIEVAFVRHVGDYNDFMEPWMHLSETVGADHVLSPHTQKISIAYDAPETTPTDKLRYDACVTLEGLTDFKPKGKVGKQTLHGGKYAVISHHGALSDIEKTYEILFGMWLPQSGCEPADYPNFMLHRKLPFQTDEESLVTDIYLPLK